ncbi:putative ribonuclease H-like domain-containing protein [Tanacetum coccineum]|uniref:Ribonuclease H-like domain-containing protein n=1 Tax=Tanacetum coccineum TaxID=301880 RepID=A0ABQ5DR59_9ASTR
MSGSDVDAPPLPQSQTPVLAHTDYPLWEVIQKGNGHVNVSIDTHGIMKVLPPKTTEETLARERERKARTTLLLALPEDHLAKFHKMTDAKEMWEAIKSRFGGNEESKKNKANDNSKRLGKKEESNALMTLDGGCVDWTSHSEEEEDYALMACNSSGSDTEVISCSKECKESYAKLKKLYDEQRAQLSDASIEIQAYTQALKKVEAQLVAHQQGQLWYEEKIRFMKIDLDDKTDVLTYHKKLLVEAEKEKEDLKAKVEKCYENEVLQSVFMNKESDLENQPLYDRFITAEGMHVVPPPMTGNYMPSGPNIEIDYSQFTYGPKQTQTSEFETQTSDFDTCESDCSVETHESLSEPIVNEPKVVNQPKVWSDAPIIEEYESDSEDEHVSLPTEEQETPSFANQQVKTPRETIKNQFKHSKNPKVEKKGDCDFHEKRMAKQAELNNKMWKMSSQREIRPIWNNVQRVNHKNQFVPTAVLTRTGKIPVNTARARGTNDVSIARHNFNSQAVLTNAARKNSTVKPFVNRVRPKTVFHKTHSPLRRPFNNTTALRTNFSKQKVNTAEDYPHRIFQNKGIVDSGYSRHMTGNKAYLAKYQDFNGGSVAFGGSKGYITGKGKIKTGKLYFEDVCFMKELQHFNLFSVSQICDKKNKVLFTDTECHVLSPEFKLPDASQVLLRIPRQNNMYSFNLENIVPSGGLACLITKAKINESNKWHRRLGHVNFKNLNKLVKGNLVRGLPSKIFQNDHTCVACQKGKQHKASCKAKSVSSISQPLQLLHMDLFGPTSVRSLNHKTYCLVITDDFSRFSWVFFLRTKDETSGILKDFIRQIENQLNQKVKTIRCDNGTEFKNRDFIEFCGSKGIKREYSNARTPQQNGVAERKNRTLIEAARTMLADSFLPNTFWAEAVSTACYVLNRVLVTKPQNKTPYELITGKIPIISYIRPFGCHVTILNTIDHLGKFDGKSDEGFLVDLHFDELMGRLTNLIRLNYDARQQYGSKSTSWDQIPTNIATAVICLTSNQKYNFSKLIFDGMLRHLDAKKKFVMYPRFISIFLDNQLANVPVPLDHFLVNTLTSKVFSFMVKKGKHFSGKVTPLFACMLVQPTEDEGAPSERPSEAQPTPSPAHTSELLAEPQPDPSPAHTSEVHMEQQTDQSPRPSPSTIIPDSIPDTSGGNLGGHSSSDKSLLGNVGEMTLQSVYDLCHLIMISSDSSKEIQHLKGQIKKLKKQATPVIKHHRAWMQSVSLKKRLARKRSIKKQRVNKESTSKQGRKFAKGEPSVQRDPLFDEIPEDLLDHMETKNAQDVGRIRDIVGEEKEIDENILSTEDCI